MQGDEFEGKTVIADLSQIRASTKQQTGGSPCLVQYNGAGTGKRFLIDKEKLSLGRAVTADIMVADASVSRTHAHIFNIESGVFIEDGGSANGTYINDKKIEERYKLNDQDMIRLGTMLLKFFSSDNVDGFIQDKIYQLATIDAGTGIFNKQYLLDTLESEFRKSKTANLNLSLLVFDLDHFKKVNDTYGHNAGDQVLRDIAKLIKGCIRKEDILARFGGEEFVVILPNTSSEHGVKVGEHILNKTRSFLHPIDYSENGQAKHVEHTQTVSIGIAGIDANMTTPKQLLEIADQKLYESKRNGRNRLTK
jgi:diguanylate cyclase (GGDEF)-like protein